jgi:lipid-A-disaccharide synthase
VIGNPEDQFSYSAVTKNNYRHKKHILFSAGETSGDFYGAGLISALKEKASWFSFFGIGGAKMKEAGLEPVVPDISPLSQIGFIDVIRHITEIKDMFRKLSLAVTVKNPPVAVLIDLPGFNIRLARLLSEKGVKVVYFVSPQVWAWQRSRIKKIKRFVNKMLVLFPFEEDFYLREGVRVSFVGHPLAEMVKPELSRGEFLEKYNLKAGEELTSLLPGSRKREVELILPPLLEAARIIKSKRKKAHFLISRAPGVSLDLMEKIAKIEGVDIVSETYSLMSYSRLLLIASGTASLEAALLGTPMVVVYKLAPINYLIARLLVRLPFISLPNILAQDKVVPELIQKEAEGEKIASTAISILEDEERMKEMKSAFAGIKRELYRPGSFSRVAEEVISLL